MRLPIMISLLLWTMCPDASARDPRPAPHCADARQIREVWQSDAHTLAIRLAEGERYRVELADACADATTGDAQPVLLTHDGWLCGGNHEKLQVDGRTCAVAGMAQIDAREFAELVSVAGRIARKDMLDTVVVRGQRTRGRGFVGTTAHCFSTQHVRGWNVDTEGVIVDVSPKRSGGNRQYRVELASYCSELREANHMLLESGMGVGAICGNAGDRIVPIIDQLPSFAGGTFHRRRSPGGINEYGCRVTRVYPIDRS